MAGNNNSKSTSVQKLRSRVGSLQRTLDSKDTEYRQLHANFSRLTEELGIYKAEYKAVRSELEKRLESILNRVGQAVDALESYPDRLPPRVEGGLTDGQYSYLLECIRAEIRYSSKRIREAAKS